MVGYPGNKSKWDVPSDNYARVYDLFMGSGGFSLATLKGNSNAKVYGAESNPLQKAVLSADEEMRSTILKIALKSAAALKLFIDPAWDGQGSYSEEFPERRQALGQAWYYLVKKPFDEAMRTGVVKFESVVAQILCGTYGYGTSIRVSGNGLNISPNAQKVRSQTPTFPDRVPGLQSVERSFEWIDIKGGRKSIALIDPPYVLPRSMILTHKRLTACYPGHEPYGKKTWDLYWKAISKCLKANCGTIVIANYYSDAMDAGVRSLALSYGYSIEKIPHGALQTQSSHKHRYQHGRRSAQKDLLNPVDFEWRLRKHQAEIFDMGQLELWGQRHRRVAIAFF